MTHFRVNNNVWYKEAEKNDLLQKDRSANTNIGKLDYSLYEHI